MASGQCRGLNGNCPGPDDQQRAFLAFTTDMIEEAEVRGVNTHETLCHLASLGRSVTAAASSRSGQSAVETHHESVCVVVVVCVDAFRAPVLLCPTSAGGDSHMNALPSLTHQVESVRKQKDKIRNILGGKLHEMAVNAEW